MIGNINSGNPYSYQTGTNNPARERSDVARAPAASPEQAPETARRDLADGRPPATIERTPVERTPAESLERRVEARRAAEDARLERFRADEIPLPTAQALSTFALIAASGQESGADVPLAGIDILV